MAALGLYGSRANLRLRRLYLPSRLFVAPRHNQVKSLSTLSANQTRKPAMAPSIRNGIIPTSINGVGGAQVSVPAARPIQAYHSDSSQNTLGELETEFLIVGAGPAGASLACFLASYSE